ncbi:unnamed protein product, partial [Brenthis ino]
MYLVEIFVDKVTIFASEEDEKSGANKKLIIKIRFGPKVEFIIKEGQLAHNKDTKDDIIDCDENGRRKWTRTIRVGKSYLFPSYPDTVLMILSKFPLEIEIWNDDEKEVEIFVGIGTMHWETQFFHMLKETAEACKLHEPLSIKQNTPLFAECCCKQVGEISFILRLSALGDSIITEFQQLMKDPDTFVFRTNKAPSMFQCKRVEGDDPNFCMVGSLYETTTLEDPTVMSNAQQKIEICTELQSCGVGKRDDDYSCRHGAADSSVPSKKIYPINKIRMGDITGPCGNTNCPLAHKVRTYIRNLEAYKREAGSKITETKDITKRKICGTCDCKDDRWHREECPEKLEKEGKQGKVECTGCGGKAKAGETCEDRRKKMFGTGVTPKSSKTTVAYVFSVTKVPGFKESVYRNKIGSEMVITNCYSQTTGNNEPLNVKRGCSCFKPGCTWNQDEISLNVPPIKLSEKPKFPENRIPNQGNQAIVYNVEVNDSKRKIPVYNCVEISENKDCECNPPKPSPPCKTFDCECLTEISNKAARKAHKPFCPLYKHKNNCPVTMMQEEEEKAKAEDYEDEAEPLPYGLPPIKLGPCPVLGRPCTVPDGFARMYKNAALPAQPPSYSDAGKVCCSKEYERIKKAIKEYMKYEKDHDFRCVNKFNVDTERRCCDKEQKLLSLMGKGCCGSHKIAIQDKFKEENKSA